MDDDASRDIREFRRLGYVTRTAYDEDNARARYRPEQRLEVRYRTGLSLRYYHLLQNDEDISDIHKRWKLLYKSRLPAGSRWSSYKMAQAVGTGLHQKTHNDWDESSVYGVSLRQPTDTDLRNS